MKKCIRQLKSKYMCVTVLPDVVIIGLGWHTSIKNLGAVTKQHIPAHSSKWNMVMPFGWFFSIKLYRCFFLVGIHTTLWDRFLAKDKGFFIVKIISYTLIWYLRWKYYLIYIMRVFFFIPRYYFLFREKEIIWSC